MNLPPLQRNRRGVFNITIYDESGARQNLTGCSVIIYFKDNKNKTDAQANFTRSIGSGLTVVSMTQGELQLEVTAANTNALDWSQSPLTIPLYWSTVLTDGAGKTWPVHGLAGVFPIVAG